MMEATPKNILSQLKPKTTLGETQGKTERWCREWQKRDGNS